jgi:hypothetical protein
MSVRFTQPKRGRWPGGIDKPIAILRAEPAELARRYRVRFTNGQDELDEFQEAALKLKSGRQILLTRYRRSPGPGTTVSVDRLDDATAALGELRELLELGRGELAWVSDEVQEPRRSILAAMAEKVQAWKSARRSLRRATPA